VAAEDGYAGQAAYAASEGGVLALTRPLARDLVEEGIRVVTIMAGRYDTMMFTERSEDVRQKVGTTQKMPSGFADAREFGEAVRRICEDDSINGQWVRLSGARAR
jgi:NAD(P)-dependent dehydrogenase (short-subunit alcohol dehydrogenase family)